MVARSVGMALAFYVLVVSGCKSNDWRKGVKVSGEICGEVRQYQGFVKLGTEVALTSAKALEAKLIIHDTIDGLIAACDLRDTVVENHDGEAVSAVGPGDNLVARFRSLIVLASRASFSGPWPET